MCRLRAGWHGGSVHQTTPTRVPEVDYLATSRRPSFESLPGVVHDAVGPIAGAPVRRAHAAVASGFGGAFAGLLDLVDGRRVFAKVAGPGTPHIQRALAREGALLPLLRGLGCASRLVGMTDLETDGLWRVLVLEAIEGTQPGGPWTEADADATHAACVEIAATPAEVVGAMGLGTTADDLAAAREAIATLERLAAGSLGWPDGHARPDSAAAVELARLGGGVAQAVRGEALNHLDVRPDNLVREPSGRMRVVDWNQAARGAPWVDLVSLWPLMHHHGVEVTRFAGSPLLTGAADDDVDAFLAFMVGFMLTNIDAPPPPGCTPALRAHALFFSDTTLRLLAVRRGWRLGG